MPGHSPGELRPKRYNPADRPHRTGLLPSHVPHKVLTMRRPALLGSLPLAWLALAACHHQSSGFSLSEIFPALQGQTFAYLDVDGNGEATAGDHIILPLTRRVRVTSTAADAFDLAVTNGSFGDGATLQG